MWTFLATDAMGFGGLFIAYGMLRVRADVWPDPRSRLALAPAAAMTFALLASSLTMTLATRARTASARRAWPMGLTSDLFASTFYLLTGFHGLHVLAGVIGIGFMFRATTSPQAVDT